MVALLVWVVALAGVSLFVTTGHFDKTNMKKPDWLDHVNTYNLKLKLQLAFAIISISGVHALKTYLSSDLDLAAKAKSPKDSLFACPLALAAVMKAVVSAGTFCVAKTNFAAWLVSFT